MSRVMQLGGQRWTPNVAALSGGLYDDFSGAAPASWWTTLLGTLATNAGALRATAIASNGYNIVGANPEFTTALTGWGAANGASQARVDSATDPGSASGGIDSWCNKITDGTGAGFPLIAFTTAAFIPWANYSLSGLFYVPNANTQAANAGLAIQNTTWQVLTNAEDAWTSVSGSGIADHATPPSLRAYLRYGVSTVGDIAYCDAISAVLNSAIPVGNLNTPNALVTASMISPAALVTPRAILLRVTDKINFVRLLLLPNTAGNDCILETVTAGVRATVAQADVDWTAGATDKVRVLVQGSAYIVEHMKAGASTWTSAFTTTTASFATNTFFGVQLFAATDSSFDDILIQPVA